MSTEREPQEGPDKVKGAQERREEPEEGGAETYGGDPDTEPSITEEDVEAGMQRDQAEG